MIMTRVLASNLRVWRRRPIPLPLTDYRKTFSVIDDTEDMM